MYIQQNKERNWTVVFILRSAFPYWNNVSSFPPSKPHVFKSINNSNWAGTVVHLARQMGQEALFPFFAWNEDSNLLNHISRFFKKDMPFKKLRRYCDTIPCKYFFFLCGPHTFPLLLFLVFQTCSESGTRKILHANKVPLGFSKFLFFKFCFVLDSYPMSCSFKQ